jgi:hypothetical protein
MSTSAFSLVLPTASMGRVILLPSQFELSASTAEQSFLSSTVGSTATAWVSNPPHASYRLSEPYVVDGYEFLVVVWFSASKLVSVDLSMVSGSDTSPDWDSWDAARELAVNSAQIALLLRAYGSHPVNFSWGTISSDYDPRGGSASITIRFTPPDTAGP